MVISADVAAQWLTDGMLVAGPLTLVTGIVLHRSAGIAAPYGRFAAAAKGWGPLLNGRFAWVVSASLQSKTGGFTVIYHVMSQLCSPARTNSTTLKPRPAGNDTAPSHTCALQTQELPSLLVPLLVARRAGLPLMPDPSSPCGALAAAFLAHYAYRRCVADCLPQVSDGLHCQTCQ